MGGAITLAKLGGRSLGRDRRASAVLGCAAAALVAGVLVCDHGDVDLAAADAFAARTPTLEERADGRT